MLSGSRGLRSSPPSPVLLRRSTRKSSSSTPFDACAGRRGLQSGAPSRSQARTGENPSFAAARASTPDPVPQSASAPLCLPRLGELDQAARGTSAWSGAPPSRRPAQGPPRDQSSRPAAPPREGRTQDPIADEHRLVEVLPAVGPVVRDLLGGDLHETSPPPSPRDRGARGACRSRRRSRTRPSRFLPVPRPRPGASWTPRSASTRSARSGAAPNRQGGSTEGAADAAEEARRRAAGARLSGSSVSSSCSASSRCSSLRLVGDDDVDDDPLVAAAARRRAAAARRRAGPTACPGWVPAASSISRSPSSVGDRHRRRPASPRSRGSRRR